MAVQGTDLDRCGHSVPLVGRSEAYRHRASTRRQTGHSTDKRLGRKLERALLKLASDVVFAHARLQRRTLEAESGGCAGRSANQPFGFL